MASADTTPPTNDPNRLLAERFRAFVTATSDVVYQMSADWHVMQQLVGKSFLLDTDTANSSWLEQYIPPANQAQVQAVIDEAIREKKPFELEHPVNRADGTIGWTFSRAIPLLNEQGQITEWFGTASNITQQRQALIARQQSEEKYRALFDSIDEGVAIIEVFADQHGQVTDLIWREANAGVERHAGIGGWVGKRASEMVPHLEQAWLDAMSGVYQTGEPVRMEAYVADLDRWIETYYSRVGGAGSSLMAAVFQNITERKQREQGQAFLLNFSDQLRKQVTPEAVAKCALELLIAHLQLDRSYTVSYYLDDNRAVLEYQLGNETVPPLPDHFDLLHYPEASKAVLDQTLVIEDDYERQGLSEAEKQNSARLGMRAMVAVTLRKGENQPLWSMVGINSTPRRWRPDQIQLIEDVAERTWTAINRVRTETELRQSELALAELKHLTLLSQTEALARMGSWEYHRQSGQFTWSVGMYQLTQVDPRRPLTPEIYLELVIQADQDLARSLISYLREGKGHFEGSLRIQVGDAVKSLRIKADVIGSGKETRVVGVDMDITQQLLVQQQIRETAESLQAVLDGSPASIGLLKAQRDRAGRIVDFRLAVGNDQLARFFGEPLAELLGQPAQRFSSLLWDGQTTARLQQVFTSQQGFYEEKQLPPPHPDSWVALSVTRQDDGILLTVLDITALKQTQAQQQHWLDEVEQSRHSVEALTQLRTALQHRSESLRAVSHDLKSNFGIITGSLSLLELAESEAEREQFVGMALRNVQQATGLLGELLDLTRLESSEQTLRVSAQNVARLFGELGENLTPLANQQGLALVFTGPDLLEVDTDELLLYRLVQNLAMNALKYTHRGRVDVAWGQAPGQDHWWFSVTDTGSGLAAHLVDRLNTPDPLQAGAMEVDLSDPTRTIGSTEPSAKESWASLRGEGIGLRIVREITHLLQARLEVSSAINKGTRFVVQLPLTYSLP